MMALPTTSADLPAMSERAIGHFLYRTGLFRRRGWTESQAETWADRLYQRDVERDPRRLCIECSNLQRTGRCAVASRRREPGSAKSVMPNTSPYFEPVQDVLQNCPYFEFQTP
jgi:hypothetical protein